MEKLSLNIAFEGSETTIPYSVLKGTEAGPRMFLSGGMHGDEVNGIAGVQRFLQYAKEQNLENRLRGELIVIPLLNPPGFMKMNRRVSDDNVDLNRSFGIAEPTTFAEAIAKTLTEELFRHCRLGIDLHDAGGGTVLLPHSRVLKHEEDGCTKSMGQLFGTQIVIEREGHPNMMAVALHREFGTSVITVETGGAQQIFPKFLEQSLQGILNVMYSYGLLDGEIEIPKEQFLLKKRMGVQVREAALVTFDVELGEYLHAGQKIGRVYFPSTQHEEDLITLMCGILFAQWHKNQIPKGKVLYAVLEKEQCHVERQTLDSFEALPQFRLKEFNFSK